MNTFKKEDKLNEKDRDQGFNMERVPVDNNIVLGRHVVFGVWNTDRRVIS